MNNPLPKKRENKVKASPYSISKVFALAEPDKNHKFNFFDLAWSRRSSVPGSMITLDELNRVLWYSSKVIHATYQPNGYVLSNRPTPSAGARHPIDLLIYDPKLSNSLCYYNPFGHSLNELVTSEIILGEFIEHVNLNVDMRQSTLIWFIAHGERTSAKYKNPESLIWRDSGALLYGIQMSCSALKLKSCPVGTLGEPFISQLFNVPIISGGGMLIGN